MRKYYLVSQARSTYVIWLDVTFADEPIENVLDETMS